MIEIIDGTQGAIAHFLADLLEAPFLDDFFPPFFPPFLAALLGAAALDGAAATEPAPTGLLLMALDLAALLAPDFLTALLFDTWPFAITPE